jgi:hypothetical protein
MSDKTTVYVITDKENNLNGVVTNINENEVSIVWENEETQKLTNEELGSLLETDNYDVEEVEVDEEEVVEGETPAQASIKMHTTGDATVGEADGNPKTKLDWIRAIVGGLADVDVETLTRIFNDQQSLIGGEAERAGVAKNAEGNQASIRMKPSAAIGESVKLQKEEMDTLFGESELTEEFKTKLTTLFESSVALRLTEEVVRIQEDFDKKLDESLEKVTEELIETIDGYFNHVTEEWLTENEVAIESSLKSSLVEEFLDGLKNLFQEHYIDVPDERVDVYESLVADYNKSKEDLNKTVNESIEKDKVIKGYQKDKIVSEATLGLTLPQGQKLKTLTESLEFDNEESFKKKVLTVKEGFITKTAKPSNILTENVETVGEVTETHVDPDMQRLAESMKVNNSFSNR